MCGIAGIYFYNQEKAVAESTLKAMTGPIKHRGPDDEGSFIYKNIGLGVRRLSVIDLVKGHQPIHNEDNTLWVVLNGEIYNFQELREELIKKGHRFYTKSDTEVIAHLYEEEQEDCLAKLNGMFALAVLDIKRKSLFIARDRLGVKPLYYYDKDGVFVFASELKSILSFPGFRKQLNPESLCHFFSLNYIPSPWTIFKDIRQLSAGYSLKVTESGSSLKQYWDLRFNGYINESEDFFIENIRGLLKKSVKRMLVSDVPLGAFLSGGTDSTSLTSLIREASGKPVKTFSVGFSEGSYDETYFAELASKHLGTEHYRVACKPTDVIESLPEIVWHADNLISDPSMLPLYLVSRLAKEHVTVCLSGDGGDELFMGYPTYLADNYLKVYKKIPVFLRRFIIEKLINSLPVSYEKLSFEYKAKKFIEGAAFPPDKSHYWWRTVFTDREKESLFSESFLNEIAGCDSYATYARYYDINQGSSLGKYSYADIKVWLADNNLVRVDAMSMAHSLEARVPFLDHELVEFVMRIPPEIKMKGGHLKYLLKKSMKDKLPSEIINRQKAGWHVPLGKWFSSELHEYAQGTLSNPGVLNSGIFNESYINNLLKDHVTKRDNNTFKIWGLLVFFKWYEKFCL